MWAVIKFEKKKLIFLKKELKEKLGSDCQFYVPKIMFKKFLKKKLIKKEINVLGDYLFCFHTSLSDKNSMNKLYYTRGLKNILTGFKQSQNDIVNFIEKCKNFEDKDGYISKQFFNLKFNKNYKFYSGPFSNLIFKIMEMQKNKIKVLMGNFKTVIDIKDHIIQPV